MPATVAVPTFTAERRPVLRRLWLWVVAVLTVAEERSELARLDDHLLADIGLDRHAAIVESQRAFWDLPPHAWPH